MLNDNYSYNFCNKKKQKRLLTVLFKENIVHLATKKFNALQSRKYENAK
jgi:hypothetical protein